MDTRQASSGAPAEFYLPGTFQFSRSPGRVERFLRRHLGSRDTATTRTTASSGPGFYLPGTPRAGAR